MESKAKYDGYVKVALSAVLEASKLAESAIDRSVVSHKDGLRDIVTNVDIAISNLLCSRLVDTGISVVSEEDAFYGVLPKNFWVVDPIDGTVNFSNGLNLYAISIGLIEDSLPVLGFVCAPSLDELYITLAPGSVFLNGKPIKHHHKIYKESLIAASFSGKPDDSEFKLFQAINSTTRGCLRTGSAAINICWAAIGRLQGAYGLKAKLWDVAGAIAIAKSAGCEVVTKTYEENPLLIDYVVGSEGVVRQICDLAALEGFLDG